MKTIAFDRYSDDVRARKARLALEGDLPDLDSCRNDGTRRTPNKRRLLANADERARAAGAEPFPSNY